MMLDIYIYCLQSHYLTHYLHYHDGHGAPADPGWLPVSYICLHYIVREQQADFSEWHQSQHYFSALETLLMHSTNAW